MAVAEPDASVELSLRSAGARGVIGCDEVGRGAIAGPVAVGLCYWTEGLGEHPAGLRDSKLLAEKRRETLAPLTVEWALHSAVGLASPAEVDEIGIIAALALAAKRALTELHHAGANVRDSVVLLDGSHDWLTPALASPLRVVTRVKADRDCVSVAGASVIAKVHRDRLMIAADAEHPQYGWAGNKGYGSSGHFAAIAEHGPTAHHRMTWLRRALEEGAGGPAVDGAGPALASSALAGTASAGTALSGPALAGPDAPLVDAVA